ncbi:MAG TPA: TIGR03435 family protein [Vicinamibacterales bacterium]|nr:TIGR03435 family protein [Vicinamibacterales bacterium]
MIRTFSASLVCVLSAALVGQSADPKPAFESADVHTVAVGRVGTTLSGGSLRGERYDVRGATMIDLIRLAYGVDDNRILGGPGWLENDHFDVLAKAPAGATAASAKLMLQALLADRFNLVVRHDSKPVPVFALTPGKGSHKMKAAEAGSGCQGVPQPGPPAPGTIPRGMITCKGVTMDAFAEFIHQAAGGYLTKEVVNETKIDGTFDLDLSWTPRGALAQAGADGISVFDALDRQLGLKIEEKKISMPVLVVEKASQKPTANAAGVGEVEGPAEFEVAEIKPSPPDAQGLRLQYLPGGRVNAEGALGDLVAGSLGIPPNLRNDLLVGMPKGPGAARYTIVAKTPSTGAGAAVRGDGGRDTPPPLGVALEMLHNLFIERFKLKTHVENQPATVYALIVDKGGLKMKKSDGADRASCKPDRDAAPGGGRDNAPVIVFRCVNTSMAELAENLPGWAGAYIDHPVADASALNDRYDFTLWWTPKAQLHPMRPEATGGGAAVDPGGMSIFESVERQLGLKLDEQKRSIPVTVIDHLEEKPTER